MSFEGVAVVVLAAGSGTRLGLGHKAHIELGGETFLHRIVRACRAANVGPIHVVGSVEDEQIAEACARLEARLVVNHDPSRGVASSVHLGLTDVLRLVSPEGALVFPVDVPLVRPRTIRLVAGAVVASPSSWSRPSFAGMGGHPVGIGREAIARVAKDSAHMPLSDALLRVAEAGIEVTSGDEGVLEDVDALEELERARAAVRDRPMDR